MVVTLIKGHHKQDYRQAWSIRYTGCISCPLTVFLGAFAKLEASQITFSQFCDEFEENLKKEAGVTIDAREFIRAIERYLIPNHEFLHAIKMIRYV